MAVSGADEVIVTRNRNGSLVVSSMVDGYRVALTYYGYNENDAIEQYVKAIGCSGN